MQYNEKLLPPELLVVLSLFIQYSKEVSVSAIRLKFICLVRCTLETIRGSVNKSVITNYALRANNSL